MPAQSTLAAARCNTDPQAEFMARSLPLAHSAASILIHSVASCRKISDMRSRKPLTGASLGWQVGPTCGPPPCDFHGRSGFLGFAECLDVLITCYVVLSVFATFLITQSDDISFFMFQMTRYMFQMTRYI